MSFWFWLGVGIVGLIVVSACAVSFVRWLCETLIEE